MNVLLRFGMLMTLVTFAASSNAQFPYNPDSDGNGAIQLNDLLDFVQLYGTDFILPVMDPSIQVLDSELLAQVDTSSIGGGISIQLFLPVTVEDESDILLFKNTELHDGLGCMPKTTQIFICRSMLFCQRSRPFQAFDGGN